MFDKLIHSSRQQIFESYIAGIVKRLNNLEQSSPSVHSLAHPFLIQPPQTEITLYPQIEEVGHLLTLKTLYFQNRPLYF